MKKHLLIFLYIFISTLAVTAQGQKSKSDPQKIDTVLATQAATNAMELLSKEQMQKLQDSLEEVSMRLKIENTAEIKLRRTLEEQLEKKHLEDSIRYEKLKAQIEASKKDAIGYSVVVAGDTIRTLYNSYGTLSAEDRAKTSTERIKEISRLYMPSFDSLMIVNEGLGIDIVFKDVIIATVTQSDAIWEKRDQTTIAREIIAKTELAIVKYKELTSFMTIAKQIGLSLLVVVSSILLIGLVNRAFRKRIIRFLLSKVGTWFKGWKIRDYELMNSKSQVRFMLVAIKVIRLGMSVIILFFAFPLLFSIFPMTQRFAGTIFGWVLDPLKNMFWAVVNYLPNLFIVLIILVILRYVIKGLKYIKNEIAEERLKIRGFYADWAGSTYNIVRVIIYAFALIVIFPYLPGSDSPIFQGVSVFLGIIVSLGSTSMIGNMVSGLVITYMRPFKAGDHVKIGDITGDVREKTAFVTRVLTNKNELITIPNSNILASSVTNYSTIVQEHRSVIFHTTVTMGYESPWRQIHSCLIEAAKRSEFILPKPLPFVLQTSLDDFYVSYQLCAYTKHPEKQAVIYSNLHMNIQDVFNENGLELMSVHYRSIRDGNEITIPEQYRASGSAESAEQAKKL